MRPSLSPHSATTRPVLLAAFALSTGCGIGPTQVVGTRDAAIDAVGLQILDLDLAQGDLSIQGSSDVDQITVQVDVLTGIAHSERRNSDVTQQLRLDLVDMGDGVATLDIALSDDAATYSLDVTVLMPADLRLEADAGSGDLRVSDLAGADLCDGSGDAWIERITGSVRICDDSGDLYLADVRGDVAIQADSGDIAIARIEGELSVDDGGGDLEIQDVTGDIVIIDDSGDIDIEYVTGDIDVDDGSGDLRIAHVDGMVLIRDGSGDILLEDVAQHEVLDDGSGDVVVR